MKQYITDNENSGRNLQDLNASHFIEHWNLRLQIDSKPQDRFLDKMLLFKQS